MLSKETIKRIEETLDEMFDTFLDDETTSTKTPSKTKSTDHNIPINIYDDEEKSVIVASVPGIKRDEIKVELSDNFEAVEISYITSAKNSITSFKTRHYEFCDRFVFGICGGRSVLINDGVYDLNKITSTLLDGILYITLPKMKSVKKDKPVIEVK